jgi:hypothetical protein
MYWKLRSMKSYVWFDTNNIFQKSNDELENFWAWTPPPAPRLFVTADFINNESKLFNISKPWYTLPSFHIHYRLYHKLASYILIGYHAATVRICNPLSAIGVILIEAPNVSPIYSYEKYISVPLKNVNTINIKLKQENRLLSFM